MPINHLPILLRYSFWILCSLLISACSTIPISEREWPQSAPERIYFEQVYEQDEKNQAKQSLDEYLLWIIRYYEGWELYSRGWQDVTADVLASVEDPETNPYVERLMGDLGKNIAGEWAKKSNDRRIVTRHLSVWGNTLVTAMEQGEVVPVLEDISSDVDDLLNDRLAENDISKERYYAPDPDDWFR